MKKRLLAALLALVMLLGMIPVIAGAESTPQITSTNLTLDSILGLNIKTNVGENAGDYTVNVKIGDDTAAQVLTSEDGTYTAKLLAHRMYEPVTVELVKEGTVMDSGTWTMSGYLALLREDYAGNQSLMDLLAALEAYGQYADYYADEDKKGLSIPDVEAVTAENLQPYAFKLEQNNAALKATASLYLDEACDIRFKFDSTAIEGKSVYINDVLQQSTGTDGAKTVYTVSQLMPQEWDTNQYVVVRDGETVIYKLTFNVLSYAYMSVSRNAEGSQELNGLLKAMYLYNSAANAYAPSEPDVPVGYVQLASNLLALTPTSTSTEDLPLRGNVANIYNCGWTPTQFAEGIELEKYSELMFYVKTSDANKYFELYEGDTQLFATSSSDWVKIELILEGNVWTLYVDGQWKSSNYMGDTLDALIPKVTLGGDVTADVYVTDLLAVKNPNYVDPYSKIADNLLSNTGTAADNIPADFENSTKLNITWTANGVAFAQQDLTPYIAFKFAIQSTAWHGVGLGGTTIADHSGNAWVEYLFVRNGEGWDFWFNGEQKAAVSLSDLSDLTFLTGKNDTYYMTELRGIADPDYVPPEPPAPEVYVPVLDNPTSYTGEATTDVSLEGYDLINNVQGAWSLTGLPMAAQDLMPYTKLKFAVQSSGYYCVVYNETKIKETNNGSQWMEIELVRNSDTWDLYYAGELVQEAMELPNNNLSDLNFLLGDTTFYITQLRGVQDPDYVPPVWLSISNHPFAMVGTAQTENFAEGYEKSTSLSIAYSNSGTSFDCIDLSNCLEVKFALRADGWRGVTLTDNTSDFLFHYSASDWKEIRLVKNGENWDFYYDGTFVKTITLSHNRLSDLSFHTGAQDPHYFSEVKALYAAGYVQPKESIVQTNVLDKSGTLTTETSIEGYSFITKIDASWNKYNFISVDLSNYTEVWFAIQSTADYGVMPDANNVIDESAHNGNWLEIRLVKNGTNWDVYYGGTLKQSVTLANNNLTDLYFRLGTGTYYVTELMGKENPENPYVSEYVQVAENFINNTPTSTTTEGLTSRDVSIVNITNTGHVSPGVVDGVNMANYSELKFWYKVSNSAKWFEMYGTGGDVIYQGNATLWTELKFLPESNGTWTFYVNGTGTKWGLTGATLKDVIGTLTLGGSGEHDVYVTDLIGKVAHVVNLVQDDATSYSIVYENGTGEAFAASELSKYFDAATGLTLSTAAYTDSTAVPTKAIVLGTQPAAAAGLSTAELDGPSDYIITTKDSQLYIYGATEQGTVNGVYAFLEEQFGLDVFYKDTYTINAHEGDLILEPFTTVGNANFDYLFSGYGELRHDISGNDRTYAYMMGTVLDYEHTAGGVHNALSLISEEEYGTAHPEWFYTGTTADGYNTGKQLYLAVDNFATGEGTLVSTVADILHDMITENPDKDIFGFSPMDIDIWPTGTGFENSDALKAEYGTNAAEYILFMNAVAQELESKVSRPITLQLLAYNKTLVAPSGLNLYNGTNVKVVPFVAPVESNFHMTFADSRNLVKNPLTGEIDENSITVADVIEGWDAISSEIHLWWYSLDAYSYFMPLNSYDNMGANYQFAYEHGVSVIFHQSQYDSAVSTDWSRMKIYLQRELAQNPYANVDALIEKFMDAYFGAGAENMKKLIDSQREWYGNLLGKSKQNNGSYWLGTLRGAAFCTQDKSNQKQWTTYQIYASNTMINNWIGYINDAKTAINSDSSLTEAEKTELCKRVDLESLPARYVLLKVFENTTYDASMEAFLQFAKTLGVTQQGESTPIA